MSLNESVLQKETHVRDRQVSALKEGWSPSLYPRLSAAHHLLFTIMETGQWSWQQDSANSEGHFQLVI